jgi:hypothetical protein
MGTTKEGVYRTTISIPKASKKVCDGYMAEHGLRAGLRDFSDLVTRALMAYCLPPVQAEKPAGLTSGEDGKRVAESVSKSPWPADLRDSSPSTDAALHKDVRGRVKALDPLADRIRNSHPERK